VVANGCVAGQTCGTAADRRKGLADAPHGGPTGRRTTDIRGISTVQASIP
jgi:hypothetical protein